MKHSCTAVVGSAVVVGIALACSGSPTDAKPQPGTPTISMSVLTAGAEGVLSGEHLDELKATITVDGVPVAATVRTAREIRFAMPPGRPCEVDGRPVSVQAGTLSHEGHLAVPGVLRLAVGESRMLARDAMERMCLQLPAGTERYVLTALNPGLDPAPAAELLFTVRAWTGAGGGAAPAVAAAPSASRTGAQMSEVARVPRLAAAAAPLAYAENPVPFDARYASAAPGDTLPWIDWWGPSYPNCAGTRDRIPTIRIVVAAVSASGRTVIAFDARSPQAQTWTSPAVRARLTRAADIADRWVLPAVREAMDRRYQPLKGAAGRWFHVFRTDVPGWSVDNNDAPQTACAYSSEVPSTVGPDAPPQTDAQAEYLAALMIHEYGHHAEMVYRIRRWGAATPPARIGVGWNAIGEAWAQTVQETAARLASNQPTGARYGPIEAANSGVPYPDFYLNGHGEGAGQSLWAVTPGARGGYYDEGTRFLMFLRERWGDAPIGSAGDRLFEHAQELPRYDVPSLAALAGMSATDALDQWSLADATDDLVEPSAAAAHRLPQLATWAPQDVEPLPSLTVSRSTNTARALSAGRGNYAAVYLFADGSDSGRGVSLTFEGLGSVPFVARITRVR
ncbi:MAG: hypothetical protein JWM27_1203 [Gemmatimonadetes bacterium]|nr:hypothetical protein [Gemmatimonadota bacterium]